MLRSAICLRFEMARLQGSSYSKCHRPKADLFPIIADAVQSSEKSLCPSPAAGDWSQPFAGKNYVGRVAKSHLFDFRKALGCPRPHHLATCKVHYHQRKVSFQSRLPGGGAVTSHT